MSTAPMRKWEKVANAVLEKRADQIHRSNNAGVTALAAACHEVSQNFHSAHVLQKVNFTALPQPSLLPLTPHHRPRQPQTLILTLPLATATIRATST